MNISFDITHASDDFDLRAGDFDSRAAFESEVREFLGLIEEGEPLVISLLPPFTSGFAAKGAYDVIIDVLHETESDREVRLRVHSERVVDILRSREDRTEVEDRVLSLDGLSVRISLDDITAVEADAIVNASNTNLTLGSGVSGAIQRASQKSLQGELDALAASNQIRPGDVIVTGSHGLPHTQHILHAATVAGTAKVIRKAVAHCLKLTEDKHISSLAMPALGTGVGGLGVDDCARAISTEVIRFVEAHPDHELEELILVLWTVEHFDAFVDVFTDAGVYDQAS